MSPSLRRDNLDCTTLRYTAAMPQIHQTAILEGDVHMADDVAIGPHCVVTGPVELGPGTRLIGSAYLHGPLWMGAGNVIYPFACLGFAPQHLKFDPATPGAGLRIGSNNVFREHVTIHRAFQPEQPTTIGDRNFFMEASHAGHDCIFGSEITIVAGARLGGHVVVEDKVIIGGNASIHQFCRVGRGAMLGGATGLAGDLPPYFTLTGVNVAGAVNLVGMRRSGFTREQIDTVRWVYRTLYRSGCTIGEAKDRIAERAGDPIIDEYLRFFAGGKRTICPGIAQMSRGGAAEVLEQE
jgi:UDP-N-acetylglucosamine acyltransferase